MEKLGRRLWLVFCFSLVYGCAGKIENETQKVNEVIYKLIKADNNSDIEAVLASYTDGIEFYPTGEKFIKGIKNVRVNYETLFRENTLSLTTEILETKIADGNAIVTGVNRGVRKNIANKDSTIIRDKFIAILTLNARGEWKIDKLIWGLDH